MLECPEGGSKHERDFEANGNFMGTCDCGERYDALYRN
jgi:hypothetical protein